MVQVERADRGAQVEEQQVILPGALEIRQALRPLRETTVALGRGRMAEVSAPVVVAVAQAQSADQQAVRLLAALAALALRPLFLVRRLPTRLEDQVKDGLLPVVVRRGLLI